MQKPPRITKFSLGSDPTVGTVLELMGFLHNVDVNAKIEFSKEFGQRDAEYNMVTVIEKDW